MEKALGNWFKLPIIVKYVLNPSSTYSLTSGYNNFKFHMLSYLNGVCQFLFCIWAPFSLLNAQCWTHPSWDHTAKSSKVALPELPFLVIIPFPVFPCNLGWVSMQTKPQSYLQLVHTRTVYKGKFLSGKRLLCTFLPLIYQNLLYGCSNSRRIHQCPSVCDNLLCPNPFFPDSNRHRHRNKFGNFCGHTVNWKDNYNWFLFKYLAR